MDYLFLRACRREATERAPVWFMRQAGRYLPEYRAIRKKVSFWELCRNPELACEVTLQPIDRFGFDAAILFSDILVVLPPMGLEVSFAGGPPKLPDPISTAADVERLAVPDPNDELAYVMNAVSTIRTGLADRVPLIGFAGAPFTLACYAVEGEGSKNWQKTKSMMFSDPAAFTLLLDKLALTVARYVEAQVQAGAQAIQLFDSWAGALATPDFRNFALHAARKVITTLRDSPTWKSGGVPIIYFANGCAPYLEDLASCGADVLGVDWRVDLSQVRSRVGDSVALQGNLDPLALFAPDETLRSRVLDVLKSAGDTPGFIFNLGHGILPKTDPSKVKLVVDTVREYFESHE